MSSIHYEPNAYYIFDRAYDSFKELYRIHLTDFFFVVRAKTNLKYKTVKWKRRMPKNIMTDAEVKLTGYLSEKKYPESFRLIRYHDQEDNRKFTFLTNAKQLSALDVANLYKKRWLIELFFLIYCTRIAVRSEVFGTVPFYQASFCKTREILLYSHLYIRICLVIAKKHIVYLCRSIRQIQDLIST